MGIVLSGVFLTNSVEKHDNMQIIKGLLLVESTIKIAGPLPAPRYTVLTCTRHADHLMEILGARGSYEDDLERRGHQ